MTEARGYRAAFIGVFYNYGKSYCRSCRILIPAVIPAKIEKVAHSMLGFSRNDNMAKVSPREDFLAFHSAVTNFVVAHAKFLRNAVEIAGSGVSVNGSHECAFGKWYDSNRDAYSALPEFAALDGPHELVHRAAQWLSRDRCEQGAAELVRASESLLGHFINLAYALAPAGA